MIAYRVSSGFAVCGAVAVALILGIPASTAKAQQPANAVVVPFSLEAPRMFKNAANLRRLADKAPSIQAQALGKNVRIVRFRADWIALGAWVSPSGLMYVIYSPPPPPGVTTREYPDAIGTLSGGRMHRIDLPIDQYHLTFNGTIGGNVVISGAPSRFELLMEGTSATTITAGHPKDPESTDPDNQGFLSDGSHCVNGDLRTHSAVYAINARGQRHQFLSTEELERAAGGLVDLNELSITCATFARHDFVIVGDVSRTMFRIDSGRATIVGAGLLLGSGEHHLLMKESRSGEYVEATFST